MHRRPRYAREAQRALQYAFGHLLNRPAARVSRADAVNTLDALAKAGRVAMAGRTMAYARACFRWAEKREKVPSNPFMGPPMPARRCRARAGADKPGTRLCVACRDRDALSLGTVLPSVADHACASRKKLPGMRWSEIAADQTVWTIPSARMKRGLPHVVALPRDARQVLATIPHIGGRDLIFSTTGRTPISGFAKAKAALDRASGVTGWRLHDIRRTGVSALAEIQPHFIVADKLLAHQPSKLRGAARVYQRHDFARERASALEDWANHILRCADAEHGPNVVTLRRA